MIQPTGICLGCERDVFGTQFCSVSCRKTYKDETPKHLEESTGNCPVCNNPVFGTKHCSVDCASIGTRRVERPSKEKLLELIATYPYTTLAKMFGVSDSAIRKWARNYGIDPKISPYSHRLSL